MNQPQSTKAFVLKGSMFTLSVMQLFSADLASFKQELEATYTRSPSFFKNAPIILDLQKIAPDAVVDFVNVVAEMRRYEIFPIGIIGGSEMQQQAAITANLGVINNTKPNKTKEVESEPQNNCVIHTKHIRSGQQVHAPKGDLIITASVSPGAEILAAGNIHVYGALNGRALAGINGDKNVRIFCSALNAELISIAGFYQTNEDFRIKSSTATQIYLENEQLQIAPL